MVVLLELGVKPISYTKSRSWLTVLAGKWEEDLALHSEFGGVMSYTDEDAGVTDDAKAAQKGRLIEEVRRRLRTRHYSLRTEQAYVAWVRRFILASGKRHPAEMGEKKSSTS